MTRLILAVAVLLGLAVVALPDVGEPVDQTVVLLLATLPLTTSGAAAGIDRDAIIRQAGGCEGRAAITITKEVTEEREGRWIVIVRCIVPTVPVAEILRTPVWEAPRRVQGPCLPSPFAGWCADGRRR